MTRLAEQSVVVVSSLTELYAFKWLQVAIMPQVVLTNIYRLGVFKKGLPPLGQGSTRCC